MFAFQSGLHGGQPKIVLMADINLLIQQPIHRNVVTALNGIEQSGAACVVLQIDVVMLLEKAIEQVDLTGAGSAEPLRFYGCILVDPDFWNTACESVFRRCITL